MLMKKCGRGFARTPLIIWYLFHDGAWEKLQHVYFSEQLNDFWIFIYESQPKRFGFRFSRRCVCTILHIITKHRDNYACFVIEKLVDGENWSCGIHLARIFHVSTSWPFSIETFCRVTLSLNPRMRYRNRQAKHWTIFQEVGNTTRVGWQQASFQCKNNAWPLCKR